MRLLQAALVLLLVSTASAQQPLQFLARPFDVEAGENVIFTYLPDESTVPYSQIKSWRWDFNGDGVWDVTKTVGGALTADQINTSWPSVFDVTKGTGTSTLRNYTPRLQITKSDDSVVQNVTHGTTKDLFGQDGIADPAFIVRVAGTAEDTITINLYANPRLARHKGGNLSDPERTNEIKMFAEVPSSSSSDRHMVSDARIVLR